MKRIRLTAALLALLMLFSLLPTAALAADPTESEVYAAMIALKPDYPEGLHWTNRDEYAWRGGIFAIGYGCSAFAFLLSDAAFGDLPARMITEFTFDDVRVGDILRIKNNTHSVIVLEKHTDHVVIAEGNYSSSIHWGRKLTRDTVEKADYILTRYPEPAPPVTPETVEPFTDVPVTAYYADAVQWAVDNEITKGTSATAFSPDAGCTRGQVVTFLWRSAGCPEPTKTDNPFTDVKPDAYYYRAVLWAVEKGITTGTSSSTFRPDTTCTRSQVVTFLWRFTGAPSAKSQKSFFVDVQDESMYYYRPVVWAVENTITTGTSAERFSPDKTCTRAQIVTFLFRFMVTAEPHEHKYDVKSFSATCAVPGYTKHTCSICGYNYTDQYTPKGNHMYTSSILVSPTCTNNGTRQYTCSLCGYSYTDNISALGHDYSFTRTIAPTTTAEGYDLYTCSRCGATDKRNVQPKLEPTTYIINKNSSIFHREHCPSVTNMNESNKIYVQKTREELIAEGYKPCSNCRP